MGIAKRLALIGAGYTLAVGGGIAAVAVNELRMSDEIQQGSGGMVAFGDMVLFVLVAGVLGLAPTWFLLKLSLEKAPRTVLAALLLVAMIGPASWLALRSMASAPDPNQAASVGAVAGLLIAFVAIPRIVLGPVLLVIEAVTFLFVRARVTRALLVAAMLMDIIPLGMFALHLASTMHS
jgi:hypothetical protein